MPLVKQGLDFLFRLGQQLFAVHRLQALVGVLVEKSIQHGAGLFAVFGEDVALADLLGAFDAFAKLLLGFTASESVMLAMIMVMLLIALILGCFIDPVAITMICVPIFIPVLNSLGIDIFTRHGKRIRGLTEPGKQVLIAGLDTDYLGRPFPPIPELLSLAESITKTLAICMRCGNPAKHTQRLAYRERLAAGQAIGSGSVEVSLAPNCADGKYTHGTLVSLTPLPAPKIVASSPTPATCGMPR